MRLKIVQSSFSPSLAEKTGINREISRKIVKIRGPKKNRAAAKSFSFIPVCKQTAALPDKTRKRYQINCAKLHQNCAKMPVWTKICLFTNFDSFLWLICTSNSTNRTNSANSNYQSDCTEIGHFSPSFSPKLTPRTETHVFLEVFPASMRSPPAVPIACAA